MNAMLREWNNADEAVAIDTMLACCGARRWASAMVALRPVPDADELTEAANRVWSTMTESDWLEAFACHPRIGERSGARAATKSATWSDQEQSAVSNAHSLALAELAEGNAHYEQQFGFTYIVCATGKSAEEMLAVLNRRLANNRVAELCEAAEQQRQIMQIRLGKWLIE